MNNQKETNDKTRNPGNPAFELKYHCMLCGKSSPETICEHCKIVVQAEALGNKRKAEKATR